MNDNVRKILSILMMTVGVVIIWISIVKINVNKQQIIAVYNNECAKVETKYSRPDEIYYFYENSNEKCFEVKTQHRLDINGASIKTYNTFLNTNANQKIHYSGHKNGCWFFKCYLPSTEEITAVTFKNEDGEIVTLAKYSASQELERVAAQTSETLQLERVKEKELKKLDVYYVFIIIGVIFVYAGLALLVVKSIISKVAKNKEISKEKERRQKESERCKYCGVKKNSATAICDHCGARYDLD